MKGIKKITAGILAGVVLLCAMPSIQAKAETLHTVTFVDNTGTTVSEVAVQEGNAVGTLPADASVLGWIDNMGNPVTEETLPTCNLTVYPVYQADVIASGTMDNGNITWFIKGDSLYVEGNGTISLRSKRLTGATKTYDVILDSVQMESTDLILDPATGTYVKTIAGSMANASLGVNRPVSLTGADIYYPASNLSDAAPWLAYASQIGNIYFAENVSLDGNFTLYFNQASEAVAPGYINASVYTNLQNVYLYADTTSVTSTSGMFARCAALQNVVTKNGQSFKTDSVQDMSAMFYGDSNLSCSDFEQQGNGGTVAYTSILNCFSNTSNVVDMRYMLLGCSNLYRPAIGSWNVSNVKDFSYFAIGCSNLGLTLSGSGAPYDIANWAVSNAQSFIGAFAGSTVDASQANPIQNLWGSSTARVMEGNINLSLWNLSSTQSTVFAFAQNAGITGVTWNSSASTLVDSTAMFAWCESIGTLDLSGLSVPALKYATAMFFESGAAGSVGNLSTMDLSSLLEAEFMFYGSEYTTLNMNGTDPYNLVNGKAMFGNCKSLTSLGSDNLASFSLTRLENGSYMFYNNALQAINASFGMNKARDISFMFANSRNLAPEGISEWNISSSLEDMTAFITNSSQLQTLDFSDWDMSGVKHMSHMAYGNSTLTSLVLPESFGLNVSANYGDQNIFYVSEDTTTYVTIPSATLPAFIKNYNWDNDNRVFIKLEESTIDGNATTSIELNEAVSSAELQLNATSTFMVNNALLPITFAWNNGSENLEENTSKLDVSFSENDDTSNTLTAEENITQYSYTASASLGDLPYSGAVSDTFTIAYKTVPVTISELVAEYTGERIQVGTNYPASRLSVLLVYSDGTQVPLSANDYSLDSTLVAKAGDNVFTVTYLTSAAEELSTTFTVQGYEVSADAEINALVAEYTGNDILIGGQYDLGDLDVYLEYNDGTKVALTEEQYTVNSQDVTEEGANTFTVTYDSKARIRLSDTFTVNGYILVTADKITAEYGGERILIGNDYNTSDVKVLLHFSNGSTKELAKDDYSLSDTKVTSVGDNAFTATYKVDDDTSLTAIFVVTGYKPAAITNISASFSGGEVVVGNSYDKGKVTVTVVYDDGTVATTTNFTVSGNVVTSTGANTFYAYVQDDETVFSAPFSVIGVKAEVSLKDVNTSATGVKTADTTGFLGYLLCFGGFSMLLMMLTYLRFSKYGKAYLNK